MLRTVSLAAALLAPSAAAQSGPDAPNPNPSSASIRWVATGGATLPMATPFEALLANRGGHAFVLDGVSNKLRLLATSESSASTPVVAESVNSFHFGLRTSRLALVAATHDYWFYYDAYVWDAPGLAITGTYYGGDRGGDLYLSDDGRRTLFNTSTYGLGYSTFDSGGIYDRIAGTSLWYDSWSNISWQVRGTLFWDWGWSGVWHDLVRDAPLSPPPPIAQYGVQGVSVDNTVLGTRWSPGYAPVGVNLAAWIHDGTSYVPVLQGSFPTLTATDTRVYVSADGSALLFASFDPTSGNLTVSRYALALPAATLVWQAVTSSPDGIRGFVGGDEGFVVLDSAAATLHFHERRSGGLVSSVALPAWGNVDISSDARVALVSTVQGAFCVDRGGQGLRVLGTPKQGQVLRLEVGGTPGEPVFVQMAQYVGVPVQVPGHTGAYSLASPLFDPVLLGTVPAGGTLRVPVPVTTGLLAGRKYFLQTYRPASQAFDNWVELTFF